jgi:hypothetical protein
MLSARQKPEVFRQELLEVADLSPEQLVREGFCLAEDQNWSFSENRKCRSVRVGFKAY